MMVQWKITLKWKETTVVFGGTHFFHWTMIMGGRVVFWCMIFVLKVMKGISQKLKEIQGRVQMVDAFLGGELGRWIILVEAV